MTRPQISSWWWMNVTNCITKFNNIKAKIHSKTMQSVLQSHKIKKKPSWKGIYTKKSWWFCVIHSGVVILLFLIFFAGGALKASIKNWLPLHQTLQDYMNWKPEETRMLTTCLKILPSAPSASNLLVGSCHLYSMTVRGRVYSSSPQFTCVEQQDG